MKAVPSHLRRGRWLFAEFLVVVLGVVVGLAADEWRTQIGDRGRRETYLSQLHTELSGGVGRANAMALRAATTKRFGAMVADAFATPGSNDVTEHELATALVHLATQARVTFVQSTYQDLLATGGSALFDPELRRALSGVYDAQRRWEEHSVTFPDGLLSTLRRVIPVELQAGVRDRECSLEGLDCDLDPQLLDRVIANLDTFRDDSDFLGDLSEYLWWTDRSGSMAEGLRENLLAMVANLESLSAR